MIIRVVLRFASYLVLLIGIGYVLSCRRSVEPVFVVVNAPEQPTKGSNARLLGLQIDGIPDRNITIDSISKVVTIVVPTDISTLRPAVSYKVTPKATASPARFDFLIPRDIELTVDPVNRVVYKVVLKPAGDLIIGDLQTPFVYQTGDSLRLPILNFYDGSYANTRLILTPKEAGDKITVYVYSYNSAANGGLNQVNVFWPVISQLNLKPGEYTAELVKENGRKALISQPLIVKRGAPRLLYPNSTIFASLQNDTVAIGGINLFADERITVLITDSERRQMTVKPVQYDVDGHRLRFLLPTSLPAGYHALQLMKDGKPLSGYSRFIIIKETDQPYITSIETYVFDPTNTSDLILERNRQYSFGFGYYCGKNMQIVLTSLTAPARELLVDPAIPATLCTSGYGIPSFTLPTSIPPGRYRLSLRYTTYLTTNRLVESEPFEKIIEVR